MVQKTMPGNRVGTHRALVCIGNGQGAGGFGMGKGQTPPDAINAAFRTATRNLIFVDLYDGFGLAHDLYGKHNSCRAIVKATPRSRIMIASPFVQSVLSQFGIKSASVKMIGRRDPYAQVRALFKALAQHENVDEYSSDRGKRYIDLNKLKKQVEKEDAVNNSV
jgi:small subunit ribosomal protein S5